MKKVFTIILAILVWCAVGSYLVVATLHARDRRATIRTRELHISVSDTTTRVVTPAKVSLWLSQGGVDPLDRPIDDVDEHSIERYIASRPEVAHATVIADLRGRVTIRVEPRDLLFRVHTDDGHRFWVTTARTVIPDAGDFVSDARLVTGSADFPFSTTAAGSYAQMQRNDYNDFLEQFTAIEAERQTLRARRAQTLSARWAAEGSGPKRYWGEARRAQFETDKARRIADLTARGAEIDSALASLAERKRTLQEKEKKSYESHLFLPKLANFVSYIEDSDFWRGQTGEIRMEGARGGSFDGGPEIVLTPRLGAHKVLLGELDGTEFEKLEKLKMFYITVTQEYSLVDARYEDQIICIKPTHDEI